MSKGDKVSIALVGGPPWGFRLGGGSDFGCPLEIAKLRKRSKAFEAGLAEGDVVTLIDHQDVASKSHGDAMKIIELAGPTLRLEIIKGVGPSANPMNSSLMSDSMSMSQTDSHMNDSQRPVEAMVVISREPSISRSTTEPARERSIPRTLTIIPSAANRVDVNVAKPPEPWTVDVTSYQFANANPPPASQPLLSTPTQSRQPPPTSPKPKFKASTLPRVPSAQKSSCPVIPTWGAPPSNPDLQHVWNPGNPTQPEQNASVPSKAPPMFKVAKVDARPQKWQPTAMKGIAYDNPKHQFNRPGMMNVPQSSPNVSMTDSYYQSMDQSPVESFSQQIPQAPPPPIMSPPSSRKPANHIPGMVNPLICDDSQGDFGANPLVRPNKKMYSDSAFYDSPSMVYPTIQEQVAKAKEISTFLESNQNKRSRGGRMFSKRKQRADEWSMDSQGQRKDLQPTTTYQSLNSGMPVFSMQRKEFGYNQVRHHPDPIKSKINAAELEQIQHNQDFLCKHDMLPPNLAFDINEALAHSQGKAGQFFERRRQRAEKYVVDENSRKVWQPQNTSLQEQIDQPDYTGSLLTRSYKSPWEAAIEGRLESAFEDQQHPEAMGYQPQPPAQVHQPLNVITNQPQAQGAQQPQLHIKYKTFKPVRASLGQAPSPASMTLPKQKTRLEMMLEGNVVSPEASSSPAFQQPSSNFGNQSIYNQGLTHPMQPSPALSSISYGHASSYSPVVPPSPAENRPPAQSSFTMTSLRRPKDYMQQRNAPAPQAASLSAF